MSLPRIELRFAALALTASLLGVGAAKAQPVPDYLTRQLSPNGEADSDITGTWWINGRGEWIAFVGDVETAGAEAAYVMRRNGSELHRISGYGAVGTIDLLRFSPDGRRVIYGGDLETNGRREIWSVLLPGSPASAVKLNPALTGSGVIMADVPEVGDRLVFLAVTASGQVARSVPFAGPAASGVDLTPVLVGNELPLIVQSSPDATKALVVLYDSVALTSRVFALPIAGPAASAVLLADANPGGCIEFPGPFTADSTKLLLIGQCTTPGGSRLQEIWSLPVAGPANAAISLGGSFVAEGGVQALAISPDGQRVVYTADKLVDEQMELWSVPFGGPAAATVRLNPTLPANGDVGSNIEISSDSTRVVYVADQQLDTYTNGWVVPIGGPSTAIEPLYIGPTMVAGDVIEARFSPDGAHVIYRGDFTVDNRQDLYWSPGDGATSPYRITNRGSMPVTPRSVGPSWLLDPAGERVFYEYDASAPNDHRGFGEQRIVSPYVHDVQLNGDPVAGGQLFGFDLFPDGAGVLYDSDENIDGKFELFTTDLRIFGDGFEEGTTAAWADLP